MQIGSCHIVYGADVETLSFDWGDIKLLSQPKVTGGESFSFGMVVLKPGQGHERHNHPNADEMIFVVSGQGEQMLDDQPPVEIGPGAAVFIPKGVFHGTVNTGWEPMRLIVVYAPAGDEQALYDIPGVKITPPGDVTH